MLPREGAEAVARALVRRERLVVGVLGIGGDLIRHRAHLELDRVAVGRVAEQRIDPALRAVPGGDIVVEQQLAEQDSGTDVGERPEGEDPVRRLDLGRKRGIVLDDAIDDAADRLVHKGDPEVIEIGHGRIMPRGEVP
jgi:hypothetical protein